MRPETVEVVLTWGPWALHGIVFGAVFAWGALLWVLTRETKRVTDGHGRGTDGHGRSWRAAAVVLVLAVLGMGCATQDKVVAAQFEMFFFGAWVQTAPTMEAGVGAKKVSGGYASAPVVNGQDAIAVAETHAQAGVAAGVDVDGGNRAIAGSVKHREAVR